jgi:hypothetical protein
MDRERAIAELLAVAEQLDQRLGLYCDMFDTDGRIIRSTYAGNLRRSLNIDTPTLDVSLKLPLPATLKHQENII